MNSINMHKNLIEQFMIRKDCGLVKMYEKSEDGSCQMQLFGVLDSRVKTLVSPGNKKESDEAQGADYFLKLCGSLMKRKQINPNGLSLKTLKICSQLRGGWGFLRVTSEMAARGYTVQWRLYNSKDYGVPQNRERIYIIGHLGEDSIGSLLPIPRKSEATLKKVIDGAQAERVYEPELSCTLSSQGGGMGAKTGLYKFVDLSKGNPKITENARCLTARYDHGLSNRKGESSGVIIVRTLWKYGQRGRVFCPHGNIGALTATDYKGPPLILSDESETRAVLTPDRLKKRQNGRRFKESGEPMFTLTGQDRHGVLIKNATKSGATPAMIGDGIETAYPSSNTRRARVQPGRCNTITTHGTAGVLMDTSPVRIRKLTPKECWRLQGFTDEQFERAAEVNSNTQLYKQAGNAVTVNVVEEIGKHIMKLIKEMGE